MQEISNASRQIEAINFEGEELFFLSKYALHEPLLRLRWVRFLHLEKWWNNYGVFGWNFTTCLAINERKSIWINNTRGPLKKLICGAYTSWSLNYGDQNSGLISHSGARILVWLPRSNLPLQTLLGFYFLLKNNNYEQVSKGIWNTPWWPIKKVILWQLIWRRIFWTSSGPAVF